MKKRQRGRPFHEESYQAVLDILKTRQATVEELAAEVGIPKRAVYIYLHKAADLGIEIVKMGIATTSPYRILDSQNKTATAHHT